MHTLYTFSSHRRKKKKKNQIAMGPRVGGFQVGVCRVWSWGAGGCQWSSVLMASRGSGLERRGLKKLSRMGFLGGLVLYNFVFFQSCCGFWSFHHCVFWEFRDIPIYEANPFCAFVKKHGEEARRD